MDVCISLLPCWALQLDVQAISGACRSFASLADALAATLRLIFICRIQEAVTARLNRPICHRTHHCTPKLIGGDKQHDVSRCCFPRPSSITRPRIAFCGWEYCVLTSRHVGVPVWFSPPPGRLPSIFIGYHPPETTEDWGGGQFAFS